MRILHELMLLYLSRRQCLCYILGQCERCRSSFWVRLIVPVKILPDLVVRVVDMEAVVSFQLVYEKLI